MGICYGRHNAKPKKRAVVPAYNGSRAREPPQKVHVYGADAFELMGQLGTGRHGSMRLMRNRKSKELVAVKYVEREAGAGLSKNTEREIINHRKLLHENIIRFHEVYVTESHLAIVMEFASGGTLGQRIAEVGPLPEAQAKALFLQLIAGIEYCHGIGIFHRDLRLENVLLHGPRFQPQLKITGFGYSKSAVYDSQPKTNVGSPSYTPPELLSYTRQEGAVYDGSSNDIWSAGVILYYMLTAVLPFEDPATPGALSRKMMQKIVNVEYSYPPNIAVSPEVKDLLAKIFVKDPVTRIKISKMREHPWLAGTKLVHEAEPVQQSSQTEQDISRIVEKARQRRQQQMQRRRSNSGAAGPRLEGQRSGAQGRPRSSSELAKNSARRIGNSNDAVHKSSRKNAAGQAGPGATGLALLKEEGIAEVNRSK